MRLGVVVPSLEVTLTAVRPPVAGSSMSSSSWRLGLVAAPWTAPVGIGLGAGV